MNQPCLDATDPAPAQGLLDARHAELVAAATRKTPVQRAWAVISRVVAVVAVVLIGAVGVVPRLVDGQSLTVLSASMEPTFSRGDIIVVRHLDIDAVCDTVGAGDIVSFKARANDPTVTTHRVVSVEHGTFEDGTSCRLTTQGDANRTADAAISPLAVRATFLYSVPWLGWARQWVNQNMGVTLVATGVVIAASLVIPKRRVVAVVVPAQDVPAPAPDEPQAEGRS